MTPKGTFNQAARIETARRSPKGQGLLVRLWDFAECGNRKVSRLKAQEVY